MISPVPHAKYFFIALLLQACSHSVENYSLAEKQYIDHVLRKIEIIGEHRYPKLALSVDKPVELVIAFRISHGGTLQHVGILQPSGNPDIDTAMLELINYSAPYPPMPNTINKSALTIKKRWHFQSTQ